MSKTVLDKMATELVGDGESPNLFFLSVSSKVVAVITSKKSALAMFDRTRLENEYKNPVCLEDRKQGTIADHCKDEDSKRWETIYW